MLSDRGNPLKIGHCVVYQIDISFNIFELKAEWLNIHNPSLILDKVFRNV